MNAFDGFSELSLLYAQHAQLVEQARDRFYSEAQEFVQQLFAEAGKVAGVQTPLQYSYSRGYGYCWYAENTATFAEHLYFWFDRKKTEVVTEDVVSLHVNCASPTEEVRQRMSEIALRPAFSGWCKVPGTYCLLDAEISDCRKNKEATVSQLAGLVKEIQQVDEVLWKGDKKRGQVRDRTNNDTSSGQ